MWKILKEEVPDVINAYRVMPRLLIALYGYAFYQTINWFMALDAPNMAQSGFVSVIVGAGAAWFGLYVNSGTGKTLRIETTDRGSKTS
jgi:hypothetical protein